MRRHKLSPVTASAVMLLFVAVCAYLGAGIYDKISLDYETQALKLVDLRQGIELNGIVIRREQLVCSPVPETEASAGERIPAGKIIAVNSENEPVYLSGSSVFYPDSDGFEYLSPEDALYLNPRSLKILLEAQGEKQSAYGKFVSGWDWYYAALCSAFPAPELYSECKLLFPENTCSVRGRIVSLSAPEDGEYIILLRLNSDAEKFMNLRKTKAELVLSDYSGYEIPQKALHSDAEGNKFVYTLAAGKEEKTAVEIIYKKGENCLISSAEPDNKLRNGLRLIISRKN